MSETRHIIVNGNEAAARIAYKTNELCAIYPITPASQMSELVASWSAAEQPNVFGNVPGVVEMQSEAGVAGAMHGALQTGSLVTTFTASQGLLLMIPNMYKIAGELSPNVIHVATRSVATHALSVFGDHSDVMAARHTGYAFLAAASVQEAMDFALIAQASSLTSRIPFVHFFDGFRTSHEMARITDVPDSCIRAMISTEHVRAHRERALDPEQPVIRGTSQSADVFFQSREAINPYYNACPEIVQEQMDIFLRHTGRQYRLFEYVGHPEATEVIISMASSVETVEQTIHHMNRRGGRVGLIKVRLFRPFSHKHLRQCLPDSCRAVAVLDRCKEPGAPGEPLYMDVCQSFFKLKQEGLLHRLPRVLGGRYGLSSKEFTPAMVHAIYSNLSREKTGTHFTVGITDDKSGLSLPVDEKPLWPAAPIQGIFHSDGAADTLAGMDHGLRLLGEQSPYSIQTYTEPGYHTFLDGARTHLRMDHRPVKAPYKVLEADFMVFDSPKAMIKPRALQPIKPGGKVLVRCDEEAGRAFASLPHPVRASLLRLEVILLTISSAGIEKIQKSSEGLPWMVACATVLYPETGYSGIPGHHDYLRRVPLEDLPAESVVQPGEMPVYREGFLGSLISGEGDTLAVGAFPADGTYPTDTSRYNPSRESANIPSWDPISCTQCGACSMACPQAAIRIKLLPPAALNNAPSDFPSLPTKAVTTESGPLQWLLQVNSDQCISCNHCIDACDTGALEMRAADHLKAGLKAHWEYFDSLPETPHALIDTSGVSGQQLQEPLFKYPRSREGCGQAVYLKLLSQLFGDRLLIANATGASSIFGGSLPTTPWSRNREGRGPAWSNSLFEDAAEFGLGFSLSLEQQMAQAKKTLLELAPHVEPGMVLEILEAPQDTGPDIRAIRDRIARLKQQLRLQDPGRFEAIIPLLDSLVRRSVWIVGGDGWAYDIGYGGLDHVLASGRNVNILVLDNELYSNTGGQMSKATPFGSLVKFAPRGKTRPKKDLGRMAMVYEDVYVASVAIGADQAQTLLAFQEAERHNGPSLIIAYCQSPVHGGDPRYPSRHHHAAVASGQWLLYRRDPEREREGLPPLVLDSAKPTLTFHEYIQTEDRFTPLSTASDPEIGELVKHGQELLNRRYQVYQNLSKGALQTQPGACLQE